MKRSNSSSRSLKSLVQLDADDADSKTTYISPYRVRLMPALLALVERESTTKVMIFNTLHVRRIRTITSRQSRM
jgi:hypothetical protein